MVTEKQGTTGRKRRHSASAQVRWPLPKLDEVDQHSNTDSDYHTDADNMTNKSNDDSIELDPSEDGDDEFSLDENISPFRPALDVNVKSKLKKRSKLNQSIENFKTSLASFSPKIKVGKRSKRGKRIK